MTRRKARDARGNAPTVSAREAAGPPQERSATLRTAAPAFGLTILSLVTLFLYLPAVDGPFVFDDYNAIYLNPEVRSLDLLAKFRTSARPLTDWTYALNHATGGFQTRHYHLFSIFVHIANGWLVYALASLTLGLPVLRPRYGNARRMIALGTAALFLVHPLATEAVAYLSGRSGALAACFLLATVLLYAGSATAQTPRRRAACLSALPVTTIGALACKEIAAVAPLALVVYDWCFLSAGRLRTVKGRLGQLALVLVPALAAVPLYAKRAADAASIEVTSGFAFTRIRPWEYLISQFGVIVHYLRLVVVPAGQSLDYDWPLAPGFWSPQVLLPLFVILLLAGLAVRAVRRWPEFSFAVLWVLVVLLPTSSIVPIADLAAERRMYLPLFGPALLASCTGWLLVRWPARLPRRHGLVYAGTVLAAAVALCVPTHRRAALLADPVAVYKDCIAKAPGNPRAWLNLAATNIFLGRLEEAERQLREAQRLYEKGESLNAFDRIGAFIYYNAGVVAYRKHRFGEARAAIERAWELGSHLRQLRPMLSLYRGHLATVARRWDEAVRHYRDAIRYGGTEIQKEVLFHLARAYVRTGQLPAARAALRRLLRYEPSRRDAAEMLARLGGQQ